MDAKPSLVCALYHGRMNVIRFVSILWILEVIATAVNVPVGVTTPVFRFL
jgi:hypothetical protein